MTEIVEVRPLTDNYPLWMLARDIFELNNASRTGKIIIDDVHEVREDGALLVDLPEDVDKEEALTLLAQVSQIVRGEQAEEIE